MLSTLRLHLLPREARGYLRVALGYYLLATGLGLLLRTAFVTPLLSWLPFGKALHAHSHTLYFGWVGLAVFALAFERLGPLGRSERWALGLIHGISLASFVAFLHGGYARPAIVVSSLSLGVWLFAAGRLAWRLRGQHGVGFSFLRVGLVYLGLAVLGALARVGLLVAGLKDPRLGQLTVFAFLHCFAWFFVFGVIGLLVLHAPALGVRFAQGPLRRQLRWMGALAWLTFPLGVVGGGEGALGWVARAAALGLVYPGLLWVRALLRASRPAERPVRAGLRWVACWFLLKVLMEGAGGLGMAELATRLRHPAILFLHVLLLGVVSGGLLLPLLLQLGRRPLPGVHLHHGGLALMSAGLALTSAVGAGWLPGGALLVHAGLLLAAVGGGGIVLAGVRFAVGPRGRGKRVALLARNGQGPALPSADFA